MLHWPRCVVRAEVHNGPFITLAQRKGYNARSRDKIHMASNASVTDVPMPFIKGFLSCNTLFEDGILQRVIVGKFVDVVNNDRRALLTKTEVCFFSSLL